MAIKELHDQSQPLTCLPITDRLNLNTMKNERIDYYPGIFDKLKNEQNIERWDLDGSCSFTELMWGLGFEMDCCKSFDEYCKSVGIDIHSGSKSERERRRRILYALEKAPIGIVGNYLFSYWRYLTHWSFGYSKYDEDMLKRILLILEGKYEEVSAK